MEAMRRKEPPKLIRAVFDSTIIPALIRVSGRFFSGFPTPSSLASDARIFFSPSPRKPWSGGKRVDLIPGSCRRSPVDVMSDSAQLLTEFPATKEFFVGIDSDGCVFDTMEIKHKECFIPCFIKHFRLQAASKYAREVWEFVNLYSKTRGVNRFPALSNALNLLAERPPVQARGVEVMSSDDLDAWLASETTYTNATLEAAIAADHPTLQGVLDWSLAVNEAIRDLVFGVPPFPWVRENLDRLHGLADLMVISQTPTEALQREWEENALSGYVQVIAGQELGSKTQHLKQGAGGKYAPRHVLMIGDAPGDFKAAKLNSALFYPIVPGREEESWARLFDEAIDRFVADQYAGDYEGALIEEFNRCLPERAPWQG